jgi:hypothetical protein
MYVFNNISHIPSADATSKVLFGSLSSAFWRCLSSILRERATLWRDLLIMICQQTSKRVLLIWSTHVLIKTSLPSLQLLCLFYISTVISLLTATPNCRALYVDEFVKWHGVVPAAYKYLGEKLLPVFNLFKLLTLCLRFIFRSPRIFRNFINDSFDWIFKVLFEFSY